MRKVTREMCSAFMARTPATQGNTHTDGTTLFLHGNAIARHTPRGLEVCTAGWDSNTTRERLNGLPGVRVTQKKGEQYLNGYYWKNHEMWTNVRDWNEVNKAIA